MVNRLICVGAGHVGLPIALRFWEIGHDVSLLEVDLDKVRLLRQGRMPFVEAGCEGLLTNAVAGDRFRILTYEDGELEDRVRDAEYVVMMLGTPLGTDYTFRFDQYFHVLDRLVPWLSPGVTLIVRSTVAPHFTRNVISSRVASARDWVPGTDFYASFCPERLVQGRALSDIDALPEIIGADDSGASERAEALFRSVNPEKAFHHVSTVEAELAKLCLNAFRYTLFGLANEFALMAEQHGADIYAVLEAANADYPRGGIPGPGPSRGPCLGKDTATLAFSATSGLIAHAAIKANENLVIQVAHELRWALGSLVRRRIGILGRAFKADTDDVRDNLTDPLVNILDREGTYTAVYDPYVSGQDDEGGLRGSDAVVLMTRHREFTTWSEEDLVRRCGRPRSEIFVYDLWNVWPWADHILGRGVEHARSRHGGVRLADAGRRSQAH
jgi:UDP-N-acetyl-D-mannosaminuronic acid dehydrogenase